MDLYQLCAKLLLFFGGKCVGKEIAKLLYFQRGAAECSCQHFCMPAVWDELQTLQMRQEQHSPPCLRSRLEQSTYAGSCDSCAGYQVSYPEFQKLLV